VNDQDKVAEEKTFFRSDIGAQSAWKGFTSQTLYIASRLATDTNGYDFFPEDLEDLILKKDGIIIEAIQIKNTSADITLSSLATTKTSKGGEGFFNRMVSLHMDNPLFSKVRIVHFNNLGDEIRGVLNGKEDNKKSVLKKLTDNHGISLECAEWLLSSLIFEKVSTEQLESTIANQMKDYVPIMAAPDLAQTLLIHYISNLSKIKGSTNLQQWKEKIYQIGTDIAAIDGYYKEYQKSLLRLCDLTLDKTNEQLKTEFEQGVSVHPTHIRNNLDFRRNIWLDKIDNNMARNKAVIVKGVSGQGKSGLCYRYLIDNYSEQLVFCVRRITSAKQAENLVAALKGLTKHTRNMVVYIDVNPGEQQWILLIQELQARGVSIPVLVSIREEDFKMTQIDSSSVSFELIELNLTKQEAVTIYSEYTSISPHSQFRCFDEAWTRFGADGPFIEFTYLLTNNQTLKQRLQAQIDNLLMEHHPDTWFSLLQLICFAGQTGCPLSFDRVKEEVACDNSFAAIQRLSNEYLIRTSEDGSYLEALHPIRAEIITGILLEKIGQNASELILSAIKCTDSVYLQLLLMDFFTKHSYSVKLVTEIATVKQQDWIACAGLIKTMLWLDVKRYVERNNESIKAIINKHGGAWLTFLPLDISGLIRPDEFIIEDIASSLGNYREEDIREEVSRIKSTLTSLQIDYEATDLLIANCKPPVNFPIDDNEWSMFGYSLFWFAKRNRKINLDFTAEQIAEAMLFGDIKSKADAIKGLYEQDCCGLSAAAIEILSGRMIDEFCVLNLTLTDIDVQCHFVPPVFDNEKSANTSKNFNHYWKIKMFNILDQIYSGKEYIEVALVGVDLLQDLGIEAMDHKARVSKSNRHNIWITEVNAWEKSRIDYCNRPNSWNEYVKQIDKIRKAANILVSDTIGYMEFLYKKQLHNEKRWDKLTEDVSSIKQLLFHDILLPKTAVDPYCLFREDMSDDLKDTNLDGRVGLAKNNNIVPTNQYSSFRKKFNDTYQHLEAFFDQFSEVLLARIKRQDLDNLNNPRLSLINLFDSAKSMHEMQKEYNILFKNYRTHEDDHDTQELEEMLTLLNIWAHIFSHPMKGYAVAYDAKQLYRKSDRIIENAFKTAVNSIGGEALSIDGKTYIMADFDPFTEDTIEAKYKEVIITLRHSYEAAHSYNSARWYLETIKPEQIYVPVYKGVPFSTGFQMPTYRILDIDENQLSQMRFPTELPDMLYSNYGLLCKEFEQWRLAIGYLGIIKMLLTQYNDVINSVGQFETVCEKGISIYIEVFFDQLADMVTKLSDSITLPIIALEAVADADVAEAFSIIQSSLDDLQLINEAIIKLQPIEGTEQKISNALACMLLLQPYVIEGAQN